MMPITRVLATTTLLCLLPLHGAVAAAYKWVDDKGETQYSQTPPNATKVEIIRTPSGTPATTAPQASTPAPAEPGAAGTPEAAKAEDTAIRAKNCTQARGNLAALKNAGDVTVKDANGLLHNLTPEERKARTEETEKNIQEFCKE